MLVRELLQRKGDDVLTARPDVSVETAAHLMRGAGVGAVVLSSDGSTVDGLITERDIVNALVRYGASCISMAVRDVMQSNPATCRPGEKVQTLMETMTRRRTRHVIVTEEEGGRLIGIVSIGDTVKSRLDDLQLEVDMLRTRFVATH